MIQLPEGKYQTIAADCPWPEQGGGKIKRGADRHYPIMKVKDIMNIGVKDIAADNAHLYLWVTSNYLKGGLDVMHAWGFRYVSQIVWVKKKVANPKALFFEDDDEAVGDGVTTQVGLGQYIRGCHELLLFGVRGVLPYRTIQHGGAEKRAQWRSVVEAPRTEHSAKPEIFRKTMEVVSHGPYIELFARGAAPEGWEFWGNEAQ